MAVKDALAEKTSRKNEAVKLTKNMIISAELIILWKDCSITT